MKSLVSLQVKNIEPKIEKNNFFEKTKSDPTNVVPNKINIIKIKPKKATLSKADLELARMRIK